MEEAQRSYPHNAFINMGIDIALYHHERWNGGGYPKQLKGEEIPLAARIMAIADQYDALRSERPYKRPLDHFTTTQILTEGDGRTNPKHFDPRVLAAFLASAEEFERTYECYQG
jgi:putative two-component system response regulator